MEQSIYKRLLRYLSPYKSTFIVALFCMIFFGASDGGIPFLLRYVLDGVFAKQNPELLYVLPVILVLFAVLRALFDFGQSYLMEKIAYFVTRDLRTNLNNHFLVLSSGYFSGESSSNLLARVTSDVQVVKNVLTTSIASLIRDSIRVVALLTAALFLDPFLAMLAFLVFPLGIYPVYKFGKRIRKLSKRGQDTIGSLSTLLQESILGNKIVKIFNREAFERQRFEQKNDELTKTLLTSEKYRALTGPINEILAAIGMSAILVYGGYSVISGIRSQGDFIAFLASVFLLYEPSKKLSKVHTTLQQGFSGAERIFEVLDTVPSIQEPASPLPLPQSNAIDFHGVSFQYGLAGQPVLRNISLSIAEGRKVALVGFSGAGKSTLIDLIPRFQDPTDGSVHIGGQDIRRVSLSELRSRIALVSQHTFLFQDTIYNNIRYGNLNATAEQIESAARAAFAYDFIMAFPNQFETPVGEGGATLSGGERQRIAIARALLKDAPILLLDEATASLDNRAEREVQAALERLQMGRTSIIIAHRLSTILGVDEIIVLRDGEVVEKGDHSTLVHRDGEYRKLYLLQFSESREGEAGASPGETDGISDIEGPAPHSKVG